MAEQAKPKAPGAAPAKAKPKGKGKPKAGGKAKKGLPKSFFWGFVLILVVPAVALLGWYAYQVMGHVAKDSQEALDAKAKELAGKANQFARRAAQEGFKVQDFDACAQIKEQYRIPAGVVYTEFTQRQLVGLSKFASDEQVTERCIQFAKAVAKMEAMSHHLRHVYVCQKAQFNADKSGRYFLTADAEGKGVVENLSGRATLHPIQVGESILLRGWQIYNQGDGCVIVGMSKSGTFSFRGGVTIIE
tara:strand:+ start:292 stop:1029 length:738 start_codon:yes stop_codon:yes gene_type:complete